MKEVLQRLGTVRGVRGSAYFDEEGVCLTAHAADLVHEQTLAQLGPLVVALFSKQTGSYVGQVQTAIFRFDGGVIVVKKARDFFLVVSGTTGIDLGTGAAGFHISVASRLLTIQTSRVPPRTSQTMPVAEEIAVENAPSALRAPRVPRV
jgi:hypothetical protein